LPAKDGDRTMGIASPNTSNPFCIALVVVGVAFTVTACAYGVMAVQQAQRISSHQAGALVTFLDEHGNQLMMAELGLLAISAIAALGTDDYWVKLARTRAEQKGHRREQDAHGEAAHESQP
jgi:hypothetical protein